MFGQTQIGALLHEEHMQTVQALQTLEGFLSSQTAKRVPDVGDSQVTTVLKGVVAALAHEVDRHFSFEETYLFPVLSNRGEGGIAEFLTEEHASILPLAKELAEIANGAMGGDGFTADSWKSFHQIGRELCEREIFHIQKEEMGLLAAISMFVDAEADAALAEKYRELVGAA